MSFVGLAVIALVAWSATAYVLARKFRRQGWQLYWVNSKRRGVRVLRLGVWRRRNDRFCNEYRYVELGCFL